MNARALFDDERRARDDLFDRLVGLASRSSRVGESRCARRFPEIPDRTEDVHETRLGSILRILCCAAYTDTAQYILDAGTSDAVSFFLVKAEGQIRKTP